MKTIYGYRRPDGSEQWCTTRAEAEVIASHYDGYALIACEMSASRVVSIR